ncbi:hypothetical protein EDD85DRAFT_845659, partial [Armillaria nabsnona]
SSHWTGRGCIWRCVRGMKPRPLLLVSVFFPFVSTRCTKSKVSFCFPLLLDISQGSRRYLPWVQLYTAAITVC